MILIKTKYLVDGIGHLPMEDVTIFIDEDKIIDIKFKSTEPIPKNTQKYEFPNCTILPGLINLHCHLIGGPEGVYTHFYVPLSNPPKKVTEKYSENFITLRAAMNAGIAIRSGVTTMRDMGGLYRVTLELKKAIEMGLLVGPRLVVAGRPLTITGGHEWPIGLECDGIDEVRKAVRQVMKDGSDFVKIFATSGGTPGTEFARFTVEELKAAAEEANRFGKRIVCHTLNREGVLNALEAGVDEVVHLSFGYQDGRSSEYEPDVGELIAKSGVYVSFTLRHLYNKVKDLEKKKKVQELSPLEQDVLTAHNISLENQFTTFRELRKLGVKIAAGDDSGWSSLVSPYTTFDGFVDELEAFTVAGMTPLEAITSATKTSAEFIGLDDRLGTIEVGKIADILVVRGEPFQNIGDLRKVQMVLKDGNVVHRKLV